MFTCKLLLLVDITLWKKEMVLDSSTWNRYQSAESLQTDLRVI